MRYKKAKVKSHKHTITTEVVIIEIMTEVEEKEEVIGIELHTETTIIVTIMIIIKIKVTKVIKEIIVVSIISKKNKILRLHWLRDLKEKFKKIYHPFISKLLFYKMK